MTKLTFFSGFESLFNFFKFFNSEEIEDKNSASKMLKTDNDILLFDKKISEMKEKNIQSDELTLSGNRKVIISLK